jgi:hypothetical protein
VPLILRITLLGCSLLLPLAAQESAGNAQPAKADQQSKADQQQFPADQQQPPTTPPPTQTDQPPTQPPTTVEPTPPIPKPTVQLPPPRPAPPVTTERDTGGDVYSIEPMYWLTHSAPTVRQGRANTAIDPGELGFPGRSKFAPGVIITVPTGHENSIEVSAFQVKGHGNSYLGVTQSFFGNEYAIHDILATDYVVKSYKVSWNYLTYPYPSANSKFRFKTLYEIRYTSVTADFNAPLDVNAAPVQGSKSSIRPSLGAGIEYHPVRHVRFEAKASGFGFPHHGDIYDAEASLVVRGPHLEVMAGGRIFHFKTSTNADQYFTQTMWGPYGGLRLIWK